MRSIAALVERRPGLVFGGSLFVFVFYSLYQRGRELTLVCANLYQADISGGPRFPRNTDRGRAEQICIDRLSPEASRDE